MLGPQNKEIVFLNWRLGLIQRQLKVTQDVTEHHFLLIHGKLLTNAVPAGEREGRICVWFLIGQGKGLGKWIVAIFLKPTQD